MKLQTLLNTIYILYLIFEVINLSVFLLIFRLLSEILNYGNEAVVHEVGSVLRLVLLQYG